MSSRRDSPRIIENGRIAEKAGDVVIRHSAAAFTTGDPLRPTERYRLGE